MTYLNRTKLLTYYMAFKSFYSNVSCFEFRTRYESTSYRLSISCPYTVAFLKILKRLHVRLYCQPPSGIRVTFLLSIYSVLYHYVIDIIAATRRPLPADCLRVTSFRRRRRCHRTNDLIYVRLLSYGENIENGKWKKPRPIKQSVF